MDYHAAIKLNPRSDQAHAQIAGLYEKLGQPHKALEHYNQAARIAPKNDVYKLKIRKLGLDDLRSTAVGGTLIAYGP